MTFVRQSAQVCKFLDVCGKSQYNMQEDKAERDFLSWLATVGASANEQRMLNNCFIRDNYRTTKYYKRFGEFCRTVLREDVSDEEFNISTRIPYYFRDFAKKNIASSRLLDDCVGKYDVIRLGFYDIEENVKNPVIQDLFHLKISRPGEGPLFVFEYAPLSSSSPASHSIWEGYAIAASGLIYLTGVGLHDHHDAVLFALQLHPDGDPEVLVGAQFALMPDDPDHCVKNKGRRDLAVVRRIAAFASHKRDYPKRRAIAEEWILKMPWGAVIPINFTPTPIPG